MEVPPEVAASLDQIPSRLRRAREKRGITLAELSARTGISTSTLSRLESGGRRPSLELLLPVVSALHVALEDIVKAPRVMDPRVPQRADLVDGRTLIPLSTQQAEPRAYKLIIPARDHEVTLRSHQGHEWLYVLRGRLRLRLGSEDYLLGPGEAAEFPCRTPHWFGSTGRGRVELLSLFGKHGERIHLRAGRSPH